MVGLDVFPIRLIHLRLCKVNDVFVLVVLVLGIV